MSVKVREFINFHQGKMTVAECFAQFNELAWFVQFIVPSDLASRTKFIHGLRNDIKWAVLRLCFDLTKRKSFTLLS